MTDMDIESFWGPYETTISSYDELVDCINKVFRKWNSKNKLFAWRGQINASWPLHSSLYRRLLWTKGDLLDERDLYKKEGAILAEVHRWGLHMSPSLGRLSILNQLAALQHYGAPTRMIDVTFNPWIGVWFAVEPKRENGEPVYENIDARLFAIDVTNRLINESQDYREWEDAYKRPWIGDPDKNASKNERDAYKTWCAKVFAWKPPHFDSRIAAQNGGFIFGGVPLSTGPEGPNQWPKGPEGKGYWKIDEVRAAISVSLRPHKLDVQRGGVSQDAVYTFRIRANAKQEIRERLQKQFGYKHSTIYPDFTGFSQFGTPDIRTSPQENI